MPDCPAPPSYVVQMLRTTTRQIPRLGVLKRILTGGAAPFSRTSVRASSHLRWYSRTRSLWLLSMVTSSFCKALYVLFVRPPPPPPFAEMRGHIRHVSTANQSASSRCSTESDLCWASRRVSAATVQGNVSATHQVRKNSIVHVSCEPCRVIMTKKTHAMSLPPGNQDKRASSRYALYCITRMDSSKDTGSICAR